jgi:hypothetical protein
VQLSTKQEECLLNDILRGFQLSQHPNSMLDDYILAGKHQAVESLESSFLAF